MKKYKEKIKVCHSIKELDTFLNNFPKHKFVLYLAHKDANDWKKSTSRVYMNQISTSLKYLPIDVKKDDLSTLRQVYSIAEKNSQIIAINQTQPHKSNPVLKKIFSKFPNVPKTIDTIIKNSYGKLIPFDLNGEAFTAWFENEVDSFINKNIILVGVGGVGEQIARKLAIRKPKKLFLIDPTEKTAIKNNLSNYCTVEYKPSLSNINVLPEDNLIVINAAGKEGTQKDSSILKLLKNNGGKNFIFVDLRPQLQLNITDKSKKYGWKTYTGFGMNVQNDYTLVYKIADMLDIKPPSFKHFKKLVAKAS